MGGEVIAEPLTTIRPRMSRRTHRRHTPSPTPSGVTCFLLKKKKKKVSFYNLRPLSLLFLHPRQEEILQVDFFPLILFFYKLNFNFNDLLPLATYTKQLPISGSTLLSL